MNATLNKLHANFFIDCEATQPAVHDAALGERSSRGFAAVLEAVDIRGTFHVIPSDLEASPKCYQELAARGHEIGLHVHPAVDGYPEFLGACGPDEQHEILSRSAERFARVMGYRPTTFCPGYASINDHTYRVLVEVGFKQGMTTIPTRVLPECCSVHAGVPLDVHYVHPFNRTLVGDLDFVEVPATVDPESRMWGGKHPQDLRVELVDAKNHWYTIHKSVHRQRTTALPVKVIRVSTHNIFEFSDTRDFRRQTLTEMIEHVRTIARDAEMTLVPATTEQIANVYRQAVPLRSNAAKLCLDRRGYGAVQGASKT